MPIDKTDKLLVNRDGASFHVMANDVDTNLDNDDLLWVQREGVNYSIRGEEIKEGIGPSQKPPDIGVFTVGNSQPGVNRFTDESFPLTMTVAEEGTPDAALKTIKAELSGTLKTSKLSSPITSVGGGVANISYSVRFQDGNYLYRDVYDGTGTFSCWYKSSRPGTEQTITDGVTINPSDDGWYFGTWDNITVGQIGGALKGYLADIKFTSNIMSFHLDFADNSSTEAIGKDVSGNNLDWKIHGDYLQATNLFETSPIAEIITTQENNGLTGERPRYVDAEQTQQIGQMVWDRYRNRYVGYTSTSENNVVTYRFHVSPDGINWTYVSTFDQGWRVGNSLSGMSMNRSTLAIDTHDTDNGILILLQSNFGLYEGHLYDPYGVTWLSEDGGETWELKGSFSYCHDGGPIQINGNSIHWVGWTSFHASPPGHPNIGYMKSTNKGASYSWNQFYNSNSEGWSEWGGHTYSGVSEDGWCKASIFRGAPGFQNPQGYAGVHRGGTGGLGRELPFCTKGQMRFATCDNDLNVIMKTDVGLFYSTDDFATYVRVGENILTGSYECMGHRSGYWWFADDAKKCYWRVTDLEDDSTWIAFVPAKWNAGCKIGRYNFRADGSGKVALGDASAFYYETFNAPLVRFEDSTYLNEYPAQQFRVKGGSNFLLGVAFPGTSPDTLTLSANPGQPIQVGDVLYKYTDFQRWAQTTDVPTPHGVETGWGFSKRDEYTTLDWDINTSLSYGNLRSGANTGDRPRVNPGLGNWYYEIDGMPYLWDGQMLNFQTKSGSYNFGQLPFYNKVPDGYNLIKANKPYELKIRDSVNIDAFAVGDYITEYGGENTGHGTIQSIAFDGGNPVVTLVGGAGSWSVGSQMISVPVFKDNVTLYCKLTSDGVITNISQLDPGWQSWTPTREGFDPYESQIVFPSVLATGAAPDDDFPLGTELTISVRLQNSVGEEIATQTVTPGVTNLSNYYYTTPEHMERYSEIETSFETFEDRKEENINKVTDQLVKAGLAVDEVTAVLVSNT